MRRQLRRLRLCAASGLVAISPFAHAQAPIAPQGQSPTVAPRPPAEPLKPVGYSQSRQGSAPGLLPPEITNPNTPLVPKLDLKLTKFDPYAVEVRHDGRHWQLWSGQTKLREFGENRSAAYEARKLIADLRLTERGAIGTPEPVMEYWLSGGQPPPLPASSRNVIPFEPKRVRVIDDNGVFYVGDDHRRLFNFGPYQEDAQQALQV